MIPRQFKGKERAVEQTSEGEGGSGGIVLPLQVVGGGVYDIAYTIQVKVGHDEQVVSLQVDTGSSDLWIASKSCSTSECGQTSGHLYDPSSSTSTDQDFDITYLQGQASGPIVWDKFQVGGYSIENQALAAADSITKEPLGPLFNGILGLALPLNSRIAELIPPVTSNSPDGAAWASNLFSITPSSSAPSARFLSLLLSRPGSDFVPAQLGIGRHPSFVTTNHDYHDVQYGSLESENKGTLFWKVGVRDLTVWVNGEARPVNIGRSVSGAVFPSAVLDSGVPLILTTSAVANGIYGAIGVGPGSDGQYYVPCTTPLNITITLDDRTPIPLHPLDLTAEPANDNAASFCVGLIQPADAVLTQNTVIGDMILGVPFLRNTYTVMAYEPPDAGGEFLSDGSPSSGGNIKPRLGLLGITDPTKALDEFNTVRVLNKPIPSSGGSSSSDGSGSSGSASANDGVTVGKHLSVGIIVLVSLIGFFALCIGLFGIRWWLTRRRYRRDTSRSDGVPTSGSDDDHSTSTSQRVLANLGRAEKEGGYAYALTSTKGSRDLNGKIDPEVLGLGVVKVPAGKELYADEETMRSGRYEAYMQDHGLLDLGLGSPTKEHHHHPHHDDDEQVGKDDNAEMGYRPTRGRGGGGGGGGGGEWGDADDTLVTTPRPTQTHIFNVGAHDRSLSSGVGIGIGVPLLHEIDLERTRSRSGSSSSRRSRRNSNIPPPMPIPLPGSGWYEDEEGGIDEEGEQGEGEQGEFGEGGPGGGGGGNRRTSMAGVGSGARGARGAMKWLDAEPARRGRDASNETSDSGLEIAFRQPQPVVGTGGGVVGQAR